MRLSLRAKLTAIVGAAGLAFIVLIVASALLSERTQRQLSGVERRLLPKLELAPHLEAQFERVRRGLQDAVAAADADALAATRVQRDAFLETLAAAGDAVDPVQAERLRRTFEEYYGAAFDVSRRLVAGEVGEALVAAMTDMQTRQTRAAELLAQVTSFDRSELAESFAAAARMQATAGRTRLAVSIGCLALVILLSLRLSRSVIGSVRTLTAGLGRFAVGDFDKPITGLADDELGHVADQANQMAANLKRLADERDRGDWLRNGRTGLLQELRGELEPYEAATRAIRFLAKTLEAPAGAIYYVDQDRVLHLLGQYALSAGGDDRPASVISFRPGEGLVGQAALQNEITVITEPPPDYLRIRSGLGEAAPRTIVLLPILHGGTVNGVIELALFGAWTDRSHEFLLSIRETLAIAIEVARARAATRQLLAETQRQAHQLAVQEEELRANNEELQTQQEELQQSNDELTQQAQELEAQRRLLQERNTDLDEAKKILEDRARELTTVSAYKSQFLANMSHELRTPLNSMLLLSNLLAMNEGGTLTTRQVEYAGTIYAAGRDLLALINQVLDLAKIEAGKYEVRIAPLPLADLLTTMERVFLPLTRDKGLSLAIEKASDVPDVILTDRQRVEQVLNNLVANAIKFTEKGQVTLRIEPPGAGVKFLREDLRPDHAIALAVSDTGLGVAPEDQDRIFAPFEQVDAAPDRRYGGTGLGLNIARELANLLGGELQMRSRLGEGSTFICYLPANVPAAGEEAVPSPPPVVSSSSPMSVPAWTAVAAPGAGGVPKAPTTDPVPVGSNPPHARPAAGAPGDATLLIIEDDQRFVQALGQIIHSQGLKYLVAPNGREGIRLAHELTTKPKAIILDIMLPDIDGWAVMEQLRADPACASIPVHVISGVEAADHGAAMGAVGYLTKPASRRDLVRMVQSLAPESVRHRCRVLVVERTSSNTDSVTSLLAGESLDLHRSASAAEALELLSRERFACMILDLSSLDPAGGLEFLRALRDKCGVHTPSVVVYAGRALSKEEALKLEAHAEAVVLKDGSSSERLLDEVRLFVQRLRDGVGPRKLPFSQLFPADVRLEGRKILIVDDDMRTVYALSAMLRAKGVDVVTADTGHAALAALDARSDVQAVLMDIMMPEMDGYEAMRRIRAQPRFAALPIIALTAKAMKGDEELCLEAGATGYLPKPVDADRLVSLLHTLLAATPATQPQTAAGVAHGG